MGSINFPSQILEDVLAQTLNDIFSEKGLYFSFRLLR